jgi:hypothetical protein
MPRTSNPFPFNNAIHKRSPIMRAASTEGVDFVVGVDEEDLGFWETFDFVFGFGVWGEGEGL